VISVDEPPIQTRTSEEQIPASLPLDTSYDESIDNPMDASVILTSPSNIAPPTNALSSEIPVSFIQRKNEISNCRTLDSVIR
jgi:hypothetical protein